MRGRVVIAALLGALGAAAPATAAPVLTPVGTFDQPVYVTAPPADAHRLFVVEKSGFVQVVVDGGTPQTFLDIEAEVDKDGEEGLLSIAFAPDYATSRRFYAYFTATDAAQGGGSTIKIEEFTRPLDTPDSAVGSSRRTLLELPHPTASNHNGGQLQVGPDGMLWLATGDGAINASLAQDKNSLFGKLLRIDPTPTATAPYSIPPDNPFANGGGRPEVWAYGLRNPWRFSFDRSTGDLVLGDVGAGTREEIDFAARGTGAGANYGWPCWEGTHDNTSPSCPAVGHVPPVFDYDSTAFGCGVMGGYVVRDPALPTLAGRYLYADLCRARLRSLVLADPAASDREEALELPSTVSFGEDSCGHVYVASISPGTVARIDDGPFTPCPDPPPGGGDSPGGDPPGGDPQGGDLDTGPLSDTVPPRLKLRRARRQRLLGRKAVYVGARCNEPCGMTTEANVRLAVSGTTKKYGFAAVSGLVLADEQVRFKLRLTKAMRAALLRRVERGAKPLVKVLVKARDGAGNESLASIYVRVIG